MKNSKFLVLLLALLLGFGMLFSGGPAAAKRLLTGQDIKNGSIAQRDLSPNVQKKLNRPAVKPGTNGVNGTQGPKGDQGPQGEAGNPASDVLGSLAQQGYTEQETIVDIGGPFAANASNFGNFVLQPGTYLLSTAAGFDRIDNSQSSSPQLMVALRADGKDFGTILTSNYPSTGDRELTGATQKVVRVEEEILVEVFAFGYNNDGSSAGSGNYQAAVEVSAIKVGVPQRR